MSLASTSSSSSRLLVVEDFEVNQRLARCMLEALGYEADIAPDGASAIAAVQQKTYGLVLMDIQMPGMDGLTAIRRIRALSGPAASVPIVALTANVMAGEVTRCKEAGANDHLGKPFSLDGLKCMIDRWLFASCGSVSSQADAEMVGAITGEIAASDASVPGEGASVGFEPAPPPLRHSFLDRAAQFRNAVAALLQLSERATLGRTQLQPLRETAHKLRGSAAAFGFGEIGEAAGRVEDAIESAPVRNEGDLPFGAALRSSFSALVAAVDSALAKESA